MENDQKPIIDREAHLKGEILAGKPRSFDDTLCDGCREACSSCRYQSFVVLGGLSD